MKMFQFQFYNRLLLCTIMFDLSFYTACDYTAYNWSHFACDIGSSTLTPFSIAGPEQVVPSAAGMLLVTHLSLGLLHHNSRQTSWRTTTTAATQMVVASLFARCNYKLLTFERYSLGERCDMPSCCKLQIT